jgi:hypothetical protein
MAYRTQANGTSRHSSISRVPKIGIPELVMACLLALSVVAGEHNKPTDCLDAYKSQSKMRLRRKPFRTRLPNDFEHIYSSLSASI